MKKVLLVSVVLILAVSLIAGCSSEPTEVGGGTKIYVDGQYEAWSDSNARGGHAKAVVTIENDEIVAVELEEYTNLGEAKDFSNYAYEEAVQANAEMPEWFVEANSADVDDFTGATSSATMYKQAVERALEKAKVDSADASEYFNGTFLGSSALGERGRKIAVITIENDVIVAVELAETTINADGEENFKDEDYGYEVFHEALEEMPARFVEANGSDVDDFTGATSSSTGWKEAVDNALDKASK